MDNDYIVDMDKPMCTACTNHYKSVMARSDWTYTYFDTLTEFREERYDR